MATLSINLTASATLKVAYNVVNVDGGEAHVVFDSWSFESTLSNGITKKYQLYLGIAADSDTWSDGEAISPGSEATGVEETLLATMAKGTKKKTGNLSNSYHGWFRIHSDKSVRLYAQAELIAADGTTHINDKVFNPVIPAKASYTITLDPNGGSGGTASLKKWYDEALSFSSGITAPSRSGYEFLNWASSSDYPTSGSIVTGFSWDVNSAQTVYAVWKPLISNIELSVSTLRVANGSAVAEADDGTWCYGICDYIVSGAAAGSLTLTVSVSPSGPSIQTSTFTDSKLAGEPLTGSIVFRASGCSVDSKYLFEVSASCTNSSATQTAVTRTIGDWLSAAY